MTEWRLGEMWFAYVQLHLITCFSNANNEGGST